MLKCDTLSIPNFISVISWSFLTYERGILFITTQTNCQSTIVGIIITGNREIDFVYFFCWLSESCLEFIWSLEMLLGWFIAPISRVKGSCKLNKGRMLPAIMISRENTLQNSSLRQSVHNFWSAKIVSFHTSLDLERGLCLHQFTSSCQKYQIKK